jgi:peptide/nickel transport system substrate-binding protein
MAGVRWFRCLLLLTAASVAAGPVSAQTKVLRIVPQADLVNLDPGFGSNLITREYGLMVFEELFAWDSKLQPRPMMVKSWSTSADGLTWRFTLRDGLKFHDGQLVTTADVTASLMRWTKNDLVGGLAGAAIALFSPVDAKTFEIKLKQPFPSLLFALGAAVGQVPVIMRAKDVQGDPTVRNLTAIGSGPFRYRMGERVSGALTVFDRNPDYVPRTEPPDGLSGARLVKVDRMEWKVIPDAATAAAALQNGEVDIWENPTLDQASMLEKNPQIKLEKTTDLSTMAIVRPNSLHPPFNDYRGRLALAYIIDQADVMTGGIGDARYWKPCRSYFVCGGPYGITSGTEDFKPDIAKAKELLAEAGYRGEKLVLISSKEIAVIGQMAEVVYDELRKAGLNVEVVWSDWASTSSRTFNRGPSDKGGWDLFVTTNSGPIVHHPMTSANINMSCDGKNQVGWPCDEQEERLRHAFLDADDAQRPAALEALHRRLALVEPYTILGQYDQPIAYRANVTGLLQMPIVVYWNIDKN